MGRTQLRRAISVRGRTYDRLRRWCEEHQTSMSETVEGLVGKILGPDDAHLKPYRPLPNVSVIAKSKMIAAAATPAPSVRDRLVAARATQSPPVPAAPAPLEPCPCCGHPADGIAIRGVAWCQRCTGCLPERGIRDALCPRLAPASVADAGVEAPSVPLRQPPSPQPTRGEGHPYGYSAVARKKTVLERAAAGVRRAQESAAAAVPLRPVSVEQVARDIAARSTKKPFMPTSDKPRRAAVPSRSGLPELF